MTALLRAKCPTCHRTMAVQPPAGGDGTVDVFPRHAVAPRGERCDGGRQIVAKADYL